MNYRLQQQHGSWANAYNRSPPPFPSPPCLLLFLILPSSYSSFLILNHPFFPLALSPLSPPLSLHPLILPPLTLTPLNPPLLLFLLCKPRPPRVPSSASDSFAPSGNDFCAPYRRCWIRAIRASTMAGGGSSGGERMRNRLRIDKGVERGTASPRLMAIDGASCL